MASINKLVSELYKRRQRNPLQLAGLIAEAQWHKKVPVITVSSPPIAVFASQLLANAKVINAKTMAQALRDAKRLAFGKDVPLELRRRISGFGEQQPNDLRRRFNNPRPTGSPNYAEILAHAVTRFTKKRSGEFFGSRLRGPHSYIRIGEPEALLWPNARFVIVAQRPKKVLLNNNLLPHSTDSMAVQYEDGWGAAAVSGIPINPRYITNRNLLTPHIILRTQNAEMRRAMMELYDFGKFVEVTQSNWVDRNKDQFGRDRVLWQVNGLESVHLLDVFNSSPEKDGSYKKYYLMVPRHVNRISQALSWMLEENHRYQDLSFRLET